MLEWNYGIKRMERNSYKDHLASFFKYYASFDFANQIICTYEGEPRLKDGYEFAINADTPMCVASPLTRQCNCASYATEQDLDNLLKICNASKNYLNKNDTEVQLTNECSDYYCSCYDNY